MIIVPLTFFCPRGAQILQKFWNDPKFMVTRRVPCFGFANIRRCRTKFTCHSYLVPMICAQSFILFVFSGEGRHFLNVVLWGNWNNSRWKFAVVFIAVRLVTLSPMSPFIFTTNYSNVIVLSGIYIYLPSYLFNFGVNSCLFIHLCNTPPIFYPSWSGEPNNNCR